MNPDTGEVWQYTFPGGGTGTVIVLQSDKEWENVWSCFCIDTSEINDWLFESGVGGTWRKLA